MAYLVGWPKSLSLGVPYTLLNSGPDAILVTLPSMLECRVKDTLSGSPGCYTISLIPLCHSKPTLSQWSEFILPQRYLMPSLLTASILVPENWNEWAGNSLNLRINGTFARVPTRKISPLGTRISKPIEPRIAGFWKYKFAKWITEHCCQCKSQVEFFHRNQLHIGHLHPWTLMGHALGISDCGKLMEIGFSWGRIRPWYSLINVLVNATGISKVVWNKGWTVVDYVICCPDSPCRAHALVPQVMGLLAASSLG